MARPLLLVLLLPALAHADWTCTVSPDGRLRPGDLTLTQALAELRSKREAGDRGPAEVLLRGGSYRLPDPIGPDLAGDGLTIRSADPESEFPVLTAGRAIDDWQARDGIWTTDLDFEPAAVIVDHRPATRARMPDDGYWRIAKTGPDRRTSFTWQDNRIHDIARSPIRFHQAGKNLLRRNTLRPADGIPPLRFNNTPERNITVEDPK